MKTLKPPNMGILLKAVSIADSYHLCVGACACFTLDVKAPNRLFDEPDMWPMIEAALDKEELFDFGVPKIRGEYLVYGSAFSTRPVRALETAVRVGSLSKTLQVFGDRYWTLLQADAPAPFTRLPVRWQNAFGGPGFQENPLGKGAGKDATGRQPLPNIQAPGRLVGSPGQQTPPAGFTAYPVTWPQRMRYMGRVDRQWLLEGWPHLPRDTQGEWFNTAPEDQRLPAFFRGDETVEIRNMHPEKPLLKSVLPGLRARLFVQRLEGDSSLFREIPCRAETLWLFPDREVGILLYRGSVPVADDEYVEILNLYGQWESLADPPEPVDFYNRRFRQEISPEPPPVAAPAPPPEPTPPQAPPAPAETPLHPELKALLQEVEALEARTMDMLKKAGLDPALVMAQAAALAAPEAAAGAGSLAELEQAIAEMDRQTASFLKPFGISPADMEKILAANPEAPLKPMDDIIADLRKAGFHKPEIEAQLKEADRLMKEATASLENLEQAAGKAGAEAANVPPQEPPPAAETPLTAEELLARHRRGESLGGLDLTGLDLSGLDFSGADFSGSVLEKVLFKKARLCRARFDGSILMDGDFTEADLTGASLLGARAGNAGFTGASLVTADLREGDFSNGGFAQANLTRARMTGATFDRADMTGLKAAGSSAAKASFCMTDLTGACLDQSDLAEADLTGARVSQASFSLAQADGLRLFGAQGEATVFGGASLRGSRADTNTAITDGRFAQADLSDACWEGAALRRSQMVEAVLDRGDFTAVDFTGAVLAGAAARQTRLDKADFTGANLSGINLFKGSLRKAVLSRTDLKCSNLFGVDLYQAKLSRSNLESANLKRTLLKLREDL